MSKYNPRLTAPRTNNKHYYSDNIFYQCGYGMPNCTAYAWGRFYEELGTKPKLCTANAENWYKYNDGYKRGSTPKLCAIGVWKQGNVGNEKDGAGHVMVAEILHEDGAVTFSSSAWGGSNFYTHKLYPPFNFSSFEFVGFIYLPIEFEEEVKPTTPTPIVNKTPVQLACEVWQGVHGNGEARKKSLGKMYNDVQNLVEQGVGKSKKSDVTSKALAREVWNRLWGNGSARKEALKQAGFDYSKVQMFVNRM